MPPSHLHFVPSRVEGLPDVTGVTVYPDRIELESAGRLVIHRFVDIARWPKPPFLWRALFRLGVRPGWLPVADRDWFHGPADMFFLFYTDPPMKVCMPLDERKQPYGSSYFVRIRMVLREGGFDSCDLA